MITRIVLLWYYCICGGGGDGGDINGDVSGKLSFVLSIKCNYGLW